MKSSITWVVNFKAGTSLSFALTDTTRLARTPSLPVLTGRNSSCVTETDPKTSSSTSIASTTSTDSSTSAGLNTGSDTSTGLNTNTGSSEADTSTGTSTSPGPTAPAPGLTPAPGPTLAMFSLRRKQSLTRNTTEKEMISARLANCFYIHGNFKQKSLSIVPPPRDTNITLIVGIVVGVIGLILCVIASSLFFVRLQRRSKPQPITAIVAREHDTESFIELLQHPITLFMASASFETHDQKGRLPNTSNEQENGGSSWQNTSDIPSTSVTLGVHDRKRRHRSRSSREENERSNWASMVFKYGV
ncbi:hypothetical protein L218DRAFT_950205 [Marasmius fiardii PR-910]|nr:hypothetical protein L218DRAFT_950205 [Marasmius fiardii PR-910]